MEGNWSSASGAQAIEKLFEQYPGMDAVFVANDQMALSVLQAAYQKGLRIPKDLGVVGFDNIAESAYFWPALTTIQQDQYNVAKVAVEEIIRIIESGWQGVEPIEIKSIKIAPALVVRKSSLRPKATIAKEVPLAKEYNETRKKKRLLRDWPLQASTSRSAI